MPFTAQHIKSARLHLQKSDPVMKSLLKQVGPFTVKAKRDRFGTLVSSIVSQQISTSAARTIRQRLTDGVTNRAKVAKHETVGLTPTSLLLFEIDELRELGVSRQKATYILDLAEKVDSAAVDLKSIGRLGDDEAIDHLVQVKGIGRWTAQMFLMFSLARLDVLPVDDLGIKNAVQKYYRLKKLPDGPRIEMIARPWRPYATIASWYLWQSLDSE
jgi:DNA-3-methyladenine glycosylase II